MKKNNYAPKAAALVIAAVIAAAAPHSAALAKPAEVSEVSGGLVTENGRLRYRDPSTGAYFSEGWKKVGKNTYYFDENGYALAGRAEIRGVTYRFDPSSCIQLKNRWIKDSEGTRYYNAYGVELRGLRVIDGVLYGFGEDGIQWKNGWRSVGGKTYYFNAYGVAAKGLRKMDGVLYYFGQDGVQLKNAWKAVGDKTYYFNAYGVAYRGPRRIGGVMYLFDNNGVQLKDGWKSFGGNTYYLSKYGVAYSGHRKIGRYIYSFREDTCAQIKDAWASADGVTYLINKYGVATHRKTREVQKKVIPYRVTKKERADLWDNYRAVKTPGKNGAEVVDYAVALLNNSGEKAFPRVISPVDEVVEVGTKKPQWSEKKISEAEIAFETTRKPFLAEKDLPSLTSVSAVEAKRGEFESAVKGKSRVSDDEYVMSAGVKGMKATYRRIPVDEKGERISGYPLGETVTRVVKQPVAQTNLVWNLSKGKEETVAPTTAYRADDSLGYGKRHVISEGAKGSEMRYTLHAGKDMPLVVTVRPAEPRVIGVGTREEKTRRVPFETRYVADAGREVGSPNQTKTAGVDGERRVMLLWSIDENGKYTTSREVSNTVVKKPVDAVISVAVRKTVTEAIPYSAETREDPAQWDNYRKTIQKGKDGSRTTVYKLALRGDGTVDPNLNHASSETSAVDPVPEITVVGTKKPQWKVFTEQSTPIPYETTRENAVSAEEFAAIRALSDYDRLESAFRARVAGKPSAGENAYVLVKGVNGLRTSTAEYAVDERGQKIPGYAPRNVVNGKISKNPVAEQVLVWNLAKGAEASVPYATRYRAEESLPLGEQKTVREGQNGVTREISGTFATGKKTASVTVRAMVEKEVAVGNVGVETVKIPFETETRDYSFAKGDYKGFVGEDPDYVFQKGVEGEKTQKMKYAINPKTGTRENGKPAGEATILKEPVKEIIEKPVWVDKGQFRMDYAHELLRLINEYRVENGQKPFIFNTDRSFLAAARAARSMYYGVFYHGYGYDTNIARYYKTPQECLNAWKRSPGHNAALLAESDDTTYATCGCYEAKLGNGMPYYFWNFGVEGYDVHYEWWWPEGDEGPVDPFNP